MQRRHGLEGMCWILIILQDIITDIMVHLDVDVKQVADVVVVMEDDSLKGLQLSVHLDMALAGVFLWNGGRGFSLDKINHL
ncbi:MAG: hypothetical protein J5661_07885 [Bacteroidaceae bacterium]|nr:hypothetical protein [Bacteroidaceae bacterium]